jgi:hypothetical protein
MGIKDNFPGGKDGQSVKSIIYDVKNSLIFTFPLVSPSSLFLMPCGNFATHTHTSVYLSLRQISAKKSVRNKQFSSG